MSILTNYHTHTRYCDGKAEPEAYITAALEKGFAALGFSAHAPAAQQESWTMPREIIPEYLALIGKLRDRFAEKIEIYCGMEIDYIPDVMGPSSPEYRDLPLDYIIGGVHVIKIEETGKYLTVDGPAEEFDALLNSQFGGDRIAMTEHYFSLLREMMTIHSPDIIAHFDLIKIRNGGEAYFKESEGWYHKTVTDILDILRDKGTILEINTGGKGRGKTDTFYPSNWILQEARKRDIPVTLSSDAHVPEAVDTLFTEAAESAYKAGYTSTRVLLGEEWRNVPL